MKAFDPHKEPMVKNSEAGFTAGGFLTVDDFSTREYLKKGGPDGEGQHDDFFAILINGNARHFNASSRPSVHRKRHGLLRHRQPQGGC